MHRSSKEEFLQTRKILDERINRHSRIAAPRAWLGNWYILQVTRGWSEDRGREAVEALSTTHAALDRDPSDALALATEGFVYCHLLKDLATARKRCNEAVNANPSHALGWLYLGTVNAFMGEGKAAVDATRRAIELSPLDPQRYYFESLGATAELSAAAAGLRVKPNSGSALDERIMLKSEGVHVMTVYPGALDPGVGCVEWRGDPTRTDSRKESCDLRLEPFDDTLPHFVRVIFH